MKAKTVTLVDPDAVTTFKVGERVDLADLGKTLSYDDACTIFGQPLVDDYVTWRLTAPRGPAGRATVTSIDSDAGVLTFDVKAAK